MQGNIAGDFSDTSSQCSFSSMMSGSASQYARYERMRERSMPRSSTAGMGDLFERLQQAEQKMQSQSCMSGRSSDTSEGEGRDNCLVGEQVLDELEKRSAKSNKSSSSGRPGKHAARPSLEAPEQRNGDRASSVSSEKKTGNGSEVTHSSGQRSSVRLQRHEIDKLDTTEASKELSKMCDNKDEEIRILERKLEIEKDKKQANADEIQCLKQSALDREEDRREHQSRARSMRIAKDAMQNKLYHANQSADLVKGQRDELADTLAGLKARHQMELAHLEQKLNDQHDFNIEEKERTRLNQQEANAILAEKLKASQKETVKAQKEADIMSVKAAMARAEDAAKGAKIQAMHMQAEINAEQGTLEPSSRLMERVFQAERELQQEMAQLRNKMKSLNTQDADYQTKLGAMQQQLGSASARMKMLGTGKDSASFQSLTSSSLDNPASTLSLNSARGSFRSCWNKPALPAIIEGEDPSNDGSGIAASGHFSNDDEGVGDLHDFDEAVEDPLGMLKQVTPSERQRNRFEIDKANKQRDNMASDLAESMEEKESLKRRNELLLQREAAMQLETAQKLAADESKIARLQAALRNKRLEQDETDQTILKLKQEAGAEDVKNQAVKQRLDEVWLKAEAKEERLQEFKIELQSLEDQKVDMKVYVQELLSQLEQAWEARRVAEMRCEDYRRACEAQDERQEKALENLRQEIRILRRAKGTLPKTEGEDDLTAEVLALRKEVKSLWEEKNILQNVLEWKEVQWQSTIEGLEGQLAAQTAQLKQHIRHGQQDLLSKLDQRADLLRQHLPGDGFTSTTPTCGPLSVSMDARDKAEESQQAVRQLPDPIPLTSGVLESASNLSGSSSERAESRQV